MAAHPSSDAAHGLPDCWQAVRWERASGAAGGEAWGEAVKYCPTAAAMLLEHNIIRHL